MMPIVELRRAKLTLGVSDKKIPYLFDKKH